MSKDDKLIEKLLAQTIKKAELETLLLRLGFVNVRIKGSHEMWKNKTLGLKLVVATHTKEVKPYQLREVIRILQEGGLL